MGPIGNRKNHQNNRETEKNAKKKSLKTEKNLTLLYIYIRIVYFTSDLKGSRDD